ncbi:MAG: protein kinase [Elusimicrobia bacterium]|nr:protein kinase [Elusimicrobiota bacterium]
MRRIVRHALATFAALVFLALCGPVCAFAAGAADSAAEITAAQLSKDMMAGKYRATTPLMFRWELLSMDKLRLSQWASIRRYVFRHPELFWSPENKKGVAKPDQGLVLSSDEQQALLRMEEACESQLLREDIYMGEMTFRSPIRTAGYNDPMSGKPSPAVSQPDTAAQQPRVQQEQEPATSPQPSSSGGTMALSQSFDDSRTGNAELEWARAQMDSKDYKGAIASASRALQHNPKLIEAYRIRAAAYGYSGEHENALRDTTASLSLNPNDAAVYSIRAWVLKDMGNYAAAYDDISRTIALEPKAASAYYNRAVILEQMGKYKEMFDDMAVAVSLDPGRYSSKEARAREKYEQLVKNGGLSGEEKQAGAGPLKLSKSQWKLVIRLLMMAIGGIIGFLILKKVLQIIEEKRKQDKKSQPDMLAHFQIEKQLGEGGMGVVYEATDRILKRKVAVKKLRAELVRDDRRDELLQEARTVASLHHPNIVEIYTVLEIKNDLYLVFEHVHGQTLEQRINVDGALNLNEAKPIFENICKALEYAHAHNIIHRDLKPSNIMITEANVVKVMDFGVARRVEGPRQSKLVAGTPAYMAPEQNRGIIRKESDIYSLGICLYETLVGHVPWEIQGYVPGSGRIIPPSEVVRTLPKEVDQLMDMALKTDPDQRMRTASHFWKVLNSISDS